MNLTMREYRLLADIRSGHVRKSETGADMRDKARFFMRRLADPASGPVLKDRVSTRKLRHLGLTSEVKPGEQYALTDVGDKVLDEWLATTSPGQTADHSPEGPRP